MSQTASAGGVPPYINRAMTFVLRSPLHRIISNNLLLITFTGRKSGRVYTTPVSYSQQDDLVTIFTHANWWKNLRNGALITLRIRGRERRGLAEPIAEDKQAIAAELMSHLQRSPFDARFYDVTVDNSGNPDSEDVKKAVETVVMVQVRLDGSQE